MTSQGQGGTSTSAAGTGSNTGGSGGAAANSELPERVAGYIRSNDARALRIEIDAVSGLVPFASSQSYLHDFTGALLDKPDGITIELDETLASTGADSLWTFEALSELARAHAPEEGPGTISVHVLALEGHYQTEDGGTVLGLAWGHRYIALFQSDLRANCNGGLLGGLDQGACEIAERNVWAHELGHTIGLVDNGVPMVVDHRDAEHGAHDVNEGCLMYWAYDRPEVFDTILANLTGGDGADLDLCEQSRADLAAVR